MKISSKRAEFVAVLSLILNSIFFVVTFLIGRWSGFYVISSVSWIILSSALIWFVLIIQFHQRALAEQEKLDTSQLIGKDQTSTIFQTQGEQSTLFAVAQKRLVILEKWFIPVFSALIAVYQVAIGFYLLRSISTAQVQTKQPLICAIFMIAIAFVSFLISRYSTGMSAQLQWKPLRAGGSFQLVVAILCFALAVGLAFAQFQFSIVLSVINWIVPILLLTLGAETALNTIFDIYRPRLKGQYSRSAFDSRLLGIINEPGGIFKSAASSIDYQFGFKVSQTWFYRLIEKAIVPLILSSGLILYLLSCLVVIAPNEQAVIERFGRVMISDNKPRVVDSGLTFKWPWPIDIVRKYPTKKIKLLNIGFVPKINPLNGEEIRQPLLWGQEHYEKEYDVLVAGEFSSEKIGEGAVPISIVKANVPIQFRVKDLYAFLYNHSAPEKLLEAICYRELARFAAGATVEVDSDEQMNRSLLGGGRAAAKKVLTQRIQQAADDEGLGVEIVFLGLQGVHPPVQIAQDYQKVVGAIQKKQALILRAVAIKNKILTSLVGSVGDADKLYALATKYHEAKRNNNSEEILRLAKKLDKAFVSATGDIFKTLREAEEYAFEKSTHAKATGRRFASQLEAYNSAPEIYIREQRLIVFEDTLREIRKFVIVADQNDSQNFWIDLNEKLTPDLYDIAGIEENNRK